MFFPDSGSAVPHHSICLEHTYSAEEHEPQRLYNNYLYNNKLQIITYRIGSRSLFIFSFHEKNVAQTLPAGFFICPSAPEKQMFALPPVIGSIGEILIL